MLTEYIAKSKNFRFKYFPLEQVNENIARDFEAYQSIFPVHESMIAHVKAHKSNAGYEGLYYCRRIVFDIDMEDDVQEAQKQTNILVSRLMTKYQLKPEEMRYFFSGKKGFHVVLNSDLFGGFAPEKELPSKIKVLALKLAEGILGLDTGIYAKNKYIRLANSQHAESELYKIELTYEEISEFDLSEIAALAREERTEFTQDFPPLKVYHTNPNLKNTWDLVSTGQIDLRGVTKNIPKLKQRGVAIGGDALGNLQLGLSNKTIPLSEAVIKFPSSEPANEDELFNLAIAFLEEKHPINTYLEGRNNYITNLAFICNDFGIGEQGDGNAAFDMIMGFVEQFTDTKSRKLDRPNALRSVLNAYKRESAEFGKKERYKWAIRRIEERNYAAELYIMDEAKQLARVNMYAKKKLLFLRGLNNMQENPISDQRLQQILLSVNNKTSNRKEGNIGSTLAQLVPNWFANVLRQGKGACTGFPTLDKIMDFDFEGIVLGIIGKSGTKKSLIAKEILKYNAARKIRGIYSSMEQTALEQFKRILNATFAPEVKEVLGDNMGAAKYEQAEIYLARKIKQIATEKERTAFMKVIQDQFIKDYGDFIVIDEESGLNKEDYQHLIDENQKQRGAVGVLVIDGLSMMEDGGKELEGAIQNSKAAKELAKEYKIMIPLLIHVPSNVPREQRELFDKTRGGSKIGDNVDVFLSLSQIYPNDTNTEEPTPYNQFIHCHFWAKRRRGEHVSFIMEMNPLTLEVKEVTHITLEELENGWGVVQDDNGRLAVPANIDTTDNTLPPPPPKKIPAPAPPTDLFSEGATMPRVNEADIPF